MKSCPLYIFVAELFSSRPRLETCLRWRTPRLAMSCPTTCSQCTVAGTRTAWAIRYWRGSSWWAPVSSHFSLLPHNWYPPQEDGPAAGAELEAERKKMSSQLGLFSPNGINLRWKSSAKNVKLKEFFSAGEMRKTRGKSAAARSQICWLGLSSNRGRIMRRNPPLWSLGGRGWTTLSTNPPSWRSSLTWPGCSS